MHKLLNLHADPGHGWLEVTRTDLHTLGIAEEITPYSYQENEAAYLEEDRDKHTFLEAAERAGWHIELRDRYHGGSCFVRHLEAYKP